MVLAISSAWICEYVYESDPKPLTFHSSSCLMVGIPEHCNVSGNKKFTLIIYPVIFRGRYEIISNSIYLTLKNSKVKIYHLHNFIQQMHTVETRSFYTLCKMTLFFSSLKLNQTERLTSVRITKIISFC